MARLDEAGQGSEGPPYCPRDGTQEPITRALALVTFLNQFGHRLRWSVDGQTFEANGNDIFAMQVAGGVGTGWPLIVTGAGERAEAALAAGEQFFLLSPDGGVEKLSRATLFTRLEGKSVA